MQFEILYLGNWDFFFKVQILNGGHSPEKLAWSL